MSKETVRGVMEAAKMSEKQGRKIEGRVVGGEEEDLRNERFIVREEKKDVSSSKVT